MAQHVRARGEEGLFVELVQLLERTRRRPASFAVVKDDREDRGSPVAPGFSFSQASQMRTE